MSRLGRYKELAEIKFYCDNFVAKDILKAIEKAGYDTADMTTCTSSDYVRILGEEDSRYCDTEEAGDKDD